MQHHVLPLGQIDASAKLWSSFLYRVLCKNPWKTEKVQHHRYFTWWPLLGRQIPRKGAALYLARCAGFPSGCHWSAQAIVATTPVPLLFVQSSWAQSVWWYISEDILAPTGALYITIYKCPLVAVCSTLVGPNTTKVILAEIIATYWYLPVSLLFAAEQYFFSSAEQYISSSSSPQVTTYWLQCPLVSLRSIVGKPPLPLLPVQIHCFVHVLCALWMLGAYCFIFVVCFRQFGWCMVYGIFTFHWILYILYDIVLLYCWKASCPIVVCWIMAWPPLSFTSSLKLWMFCWSCPLVYVVPLLLFFHCCCFSIVLDSLVRLEENSSSCWCKNQSSVLNIESVAGSYAEKSGCYAGEASCKVHAWNWNMCWNYSCCKDEARCG